MSLSWTDIIVFTILAILAGNGTYQGFLRSLVGPGSFVIASAVGYHVFLVTHQFMVGLFLAVLGPLLLTWGVNSFIKIKLGDKPTTLTFISRIGGAIINLLWGGSILLLTLLMVTMLPLKQTGLDAIKKDMEASFTYRALEKVIVGKKQVVKNITPQDCLNGLCSLTAEDLADLQSDKDIQDLMNDPRIQKIINDPELRDAAERRDIPGLLKSPAMMELSQDPALIAKFFKVYPKIKARINKDP
jgi:uncharacterized membrane protein required for colicin V production